MASAPATGELRAGRDQAEDRPWETAGAVDRRIVLCLEAPDAVLKWRTLMGATDPAKAGPGTLRKEFGASIDNNATHGSDAADTAAFELGYFFRGMELG